MKLDIVWSVGRCLVLAGSAVGIAVAAQPTNRNPVNPEAAALAPAGNPLFPGAREQFIAIEQIARLPQSQQTKELPRLYRELAPPFMSLFVEGIVSSMPKHLLALDREYGSPDGYVKELEEAASTMTPAEVADEIIANHHEIILRVAARRRSMGALLQHREEVVQLLRADLATGETNAMRRAFQYIPELHLTELLDQTLSIYLQNGRFAKEAHNALVFLKDPKVVKALIQDIETHPEALQRHSLLLGGLLYRKPAQPVLLKLLHAPDSDTRFYATQALAESGDPVLAAEVPQLLMETDIRIQLASVRMALALPPESFAKVRPTLIPLLKSNTPELRLQVVCGLAKRKDAVSAPTLLEYLKGPGRSPAGGVEVQIMQAIAVLTGQTFHYDMHHWGRNSTANLRAIAAFEQWIDNQPSSER